MGGQNKRQGGKEGVWRAVGGNGVELNRKRRGCGNRVGRERRGEGSN